MKRSILLLTLLFILTIHARLKAQQTVQTFIQRTSYLLYLPDNYEKDTTTRWPLLLFLHGSGEVGDSIQWVERNGPPALAAKGKRFPFILVSPQSVAYKWNTNNLMDLLTSIKKNYRVDENRIYITGLSMGGFGVWDMAEQFPGEFAAVMPVSGGGDTTKAWKLRHLAIWCFHGLKDNVVPPSGDVDMILAVKKYNPMAKLTLYPQYGHDCWTATYNNDTLYTWMLAQKKFSYQQAVIAPSLLNKYCGTYTGTDRDTMRVEIKNNALLVSREDWSSPLLHAGNNLFFINGDSADEFRFQMDTEGKVSSLEIWADEKYTFRKSPDGNGK